MQLWQENKKRVFEVEKESWNMKFERKRDIIAERNKLQDKIKTKENIIAKMQEALNGEKHMVGAQCCGCVNLLRGTTLCMGVEVEEKICKLDIKCKDRVEE